MQVRSPASSPRRAQTTDVPELPEVETIIRGMAKRVVNRRILDVDFREPRTVVGDPEKTARRLRGQFIRGIRRHGKYIVFELENERPSPPRRCCLVVHLRMSGNFVLDGEPGPYTRVVVELEGGPAMVFHDIRKFGRWQVSDGLPTRLRELGPEPLEIGEDEFVKKLRGRRAMAKALLLNQEFLRGLGNIYADESLFRARIHPRAITSRISPRRAARLHRAIQEVLTDAIALGGSTINNYVNSEGVQGYFQLSTAVYGKAGNECPVCGRAILRIIVASRSTHYCGRCQRA